MATATATKEVKTVALTVGQVFALFAVGFLLGAIVMMRGTDEPAGASEDTQTSSTVITRPSPKG